MHETHESRATAAGRPLQHLLIAGRIAKSEDGTLADEALNPFRLARLVVDEENLRQLNQHWRTVSHFVFEFAHAPHDLVGWNPVRIGRERAHKLDASAGHDKRLEPVRTQVSEQLEHRLIDHFVIRALEPWMPRGFEPLPRDLIELGGGHAGVRLRDDFQYSF